MKHFEPKDLKVPEVFQLLLSGVAPRPIALVSTLNEDGGYNLSPFSFFNTFGSNPPTVAFSPSTRVRDGSKKDTYHNLKRDKECTIQAVTFDMVEQVNLASTEYQSGMDEFVKSGLTPIASDLVKPPRVKESPFQMECALEKEVSLGDGKGSGNLMICRVLKFHIAQEIYGEKGIDPQRLDLVSRMGANWYCRASGDAVFEVEKPTSSLGMGYDQLPEHVKASHVFSANDLAKLAMAQSIPSQQDVAALTAELKESISLPGNTDPVRMYERYRRMGDYYSMFSIALQLKKQNHPLSTWKIEMAAKTALEKGDRDFAWKAAMAVE